MKFLILPILICLKLVGQTSFTIEGGIYGLYLPQKFYKNPEEYYAIPYVDISYKRIHFFPRYNFDILNTGTLNWGYDLIQTKDKNLVITPSLGWAFGNLKGPLAGFQVAYKKGNFQLYGINQYLFSSADRNSQNWYTWSEVNYKIVRFLRVGFSVFLRQFPFNKQTFVDVGPVLITEINKIKFSTYLMNPWNEKFYLFVGIGYIFETKSKKSINTSSI